MKIKNSVSLLFHRRRHTNAYFHFCLCVCLCALWKQVFTVKLLSW